MTGNRPRPPTHDRTHLLETQSQPRHNSWQADTPVFSALRHPAPPGGLLRLFQDINQHRED